MLMNSDSAELPEIGNKTVAMHSNQVWPTSARGGRATIGQIDDGSNVDLTAARTPRDHRSSSNNVVGARSQKSAKMYGHKSSHPDGLR